MSSNIICTYTHITYIHKHMYRWIYNVYTQKSFMYTNIIHHCELKKLFYLSFTHFFYVALLVGRGLV